MLRIRTIDRENGPANNIEVRWPSACMLPGSPDVPVHAKDILSRWASSKLPEWKREWKVLAPRVCLAKLVEGLDIEEVNSYLLEAFPVTGVGTDWFLHKGDHDFSMVPLTVILYLFGKKEDLLFPRTRGHILEKLLVLSGPRGSLKAPNSLGLKTETENHILMMEGCRHLKNRWYEVHDGKGPSATSRALEGWLTEHLKRKTNEGLTEFNSQPYSGYTLTALLVLSVFGGPDVSEASKELLEKLNLFYAYGSLSFRRYPPFHRRRDHKGEGWLDVDYHTSVMKVWSLRSGIEVKDPMIRAGHEHALIASILPYDLPEKVKAVLRGDVEETLVRIGHGKGSSPEVYSKGPGYLISAGGARCKLLTEDVIRPTVVLFDDGARDLEDVIHLGLPDRMLKRPNNIGVHHRFAVSTGPVHIPDGFKVIEKMGDWSLLERSGIRMVVHSGSEPGLVALFPPDSPLTGLKEVLEPNGDPVRLESRFRFPDGREVLYDLSARPGRYPIRSGTDPTGGFETGRWPLFTQVPYHKG